MTIAGLLLLGLMAPFLSPGQFVLPSFLGIIFPVIWLVALALILLSLIIERKLNYFLALPLSLSLLFISRHYALGKSTTDASNSMRILSLNVQVGRVIFDQTKILSPTNLERFEELLDDDLDIVCLQEMNPKVSAWIADEALFPFSFQAAHKGTFIASRHEILDFGEIDFGTRRNSCIWVDVESPFGPVRIYNVHLQSSKITEDTERALDESRRYNSEVFGLLRSILFKYEKHAITRARQAERIKSHAAPVDYPVIIAGDFNETPMSYVYQLFSREMKDAFQAGSGMGLTFPHKRTLLRIDYVFLSKSLNALNFEVRRNISLSDHLPIVVTVGKNNTD